MDINQIRKAIKEGKINVTEHADEELAAITSPMYNTAILIMDRI